MEEQRTRFQKLLLLLLATMAVLFGLLTGLSRSHRGVLFQDTLLKAAVSGEQAVYSGRVSGEDVTITVTQESSSLTTVEFVLGSRFHDICAVEYPLEPIRTVSGNTVNGIRITKNGSVLFEGGYDENMEYGWYNPSGEWDPPVSSLIVTGGDTSLWDSYETTGSTVMRFARGPELTARGSWALYVLMVFFTLLVMLDVAFPTALFYLRYSWNVRDPEPSDFYLAMQRVSWVVLPVILLIGYAEALRLLP